MSRKGRGIVIAAVKMAEKRKPTSFWVGAPRDGFSKRCARETSIPTSASAVSWRTDAAKPR